MPHTQADVEVDWRDDGLLAWLKTHDNQWIAHLTVQQWYEDQQLEPSIAWVVSWMDPAEPSMQTAAIEIPARTADDDTRRSYLVGSALASIAKPPSNPKPFGFPGPTPNDATEWSRHLDLQLGSWEQTFGELTDAFARDVDDQRGEFDRYRLLTQTLEWTYAIDSALGMLWKTRPDSVREQRSKKTDARALAAEVNNAKLSPTFDVNTDPAFAAYVRRQRDSLPYAHWSDVMLAGAFQREFFLAMQWMRGQLVHAATGAPLELLQYRAGAQPRWKWRDSDTFARGRPDDAGRRAYDSVLAGRDVLGLLGHLDSLFREATHDLIQLM